MLQHSHTSRLAAITVTYHPDIKVLARQAAALPQDVFLVVVDNASTTAEVASIKNVILSRAAAHLIQNKTNVGLAAAVNRGVDHVASFVPSCEFILLLDQDSEPLPHSVDQLVNNLLHLEESGVRVGCVGPRLLDVDTGLQHGFHYIRGWRWSRRYPEEGEDDPVECANLNGSGSLMRVNLFQEMGGLDDSLFIDHVDTEWAFRVMAGGYRLFGVPNAVFKHRMGDRGFRFWCFGWHVWPDRSPQRHYYLFRNAVQLFCRPYVPRVWQCWAPLKLTMTLLAHAIFDTRRRAQVCSMLRGIRDGRRLSRLAKKRVAA